MNTAILAVGAAGIAAAAFIFVSLRKPKAAVGVNAPPLKQTTATGFQDVARHGSEPQGTALGATSLKDVTSAVSTAGALLGGLGSLASNLWGGGAGGGGDSSGGFSSDVSGASLDAGGIGGDATLAEFSGGATEDGSYDFGAGFDFGGDY